MSQTTKEINRVTGTVISVSLKLIVFAVTILLLYEGVTRGYEFGYHVFCDTAAAEEPGVDMRVTIGEGEKNWRHCGSIGKRRPDQKPLYIPDPVPVL